MTTIINFYGGPSTGKSTAASYLYYLCKSKEMNAELVREYVKEWAWSSRIPNTYDQIYIMGKQVRRESSLYGKVDWIITDSPVLQNVFYAEKFCPPGFATGCRAATLAFYEQAELDKHKHIHVMLKRFAPYKSEGRYQNEDEAKEIDAGLHKLLKGVGVSYKETTSSEKDISALLEEILIND